MRKVNNLRYVVMLFLIVGIQGMAFSAGSVRVLSFHAADSPAEISQIQYVTASNEYYLTITNNSEKDIREIVLKGIVFESNDELAGSFLKALNIELKTKESKSVSIIFEEKINADDDAVSKSFNKMFQGNNVVILIPYKVIFKSIPDKNGEIQKESYWMLDYKLLKDLNPVNINSFKKIQGKIVSQRVQSAPEEVCYFCEWCQEEAYACGLAMISSNCRPYACTLSWYCSCSKWECKISCKSPDQCC